jgi:hypothetical protein
MHKGPDSIRLITKDLYANLAAAGVNMEDDVTKFQMFRYLSAGEAYCRIFNYQLTRSSVGCDRLPVHLDGMDWVGDEAQGATVSKLDMYFNRPLALLHLKYLEYYSQYNIVPCNAAERAAAADSGGDLYKPKRGNAYYIDNCQPCNKVRLRNPGSLHVARMYSVPVTQGELFYLRKLLTCVPGKNFKDMRTVGGRVYASYREAAEARGLLTVEREFAEGLEYLARGLGTGLSTVGDIRHTFVMMAVTSGEGVPVQQLYDMFKYTMALDIDVSGSISPPGKEAKGPLYVRLPVLEFVEGAEGDLAAYPVHEYHLLRTLQDLLQRNFSRSLEDIGLPTLEAFAARREDAAAPLLQRALEGYLYVAPAGAPHQ